MLTNIENSVISKVLKRPYNKGIVSAAVNGEYGENIKTIFAENGIDENNESCWKGRWAIFCVSQTGKAYQFPTFEEIDDKSIENIVESVERVYDRLIGSVEGSLGYKFHRLFKLVMGFGKRFGKR